MQHARHFALAQAVDRFTKVRLRLVAAAARHCRSGQQPIREREHRGSLFKGDNSGVRGDGGTKTRLGVYIRKVSRPSQKGRGG